MGIRPSPIVYNDKIYVASIHNEKLYCLSMSGQVEWSIETGRTAGSVGISDDALYLVTMANRLYKITLSGSVVWNVSSNNGGNSYTPVVHDDYVYLGVISRYMRAYNATDGSLIFEAYQPYIGAENSHGSVTYVPSWALTAINSSGYSFGNSAVVIGQAGPTLACMKADDGSNIWSNWAGWEIWGSPVVAGIGSSTAAYIGSDSGSIQVVNASNGAPLSWFTTGSQISSSPAIWDGKLYVGSTDNKLYCFEDHPNQEMATSISVDTNNLNLGDSVTVTMQLTKIPDINVYEEIGRPAPVPGLPNATVLATFTDPDGTEHNVNAVTDNLGWASFTYTPDKAGTWKVVTWYEGEDHPTYSYGYAFSDEATLDVSGGAEPTTSPTPTGGEEFPMMYAYIAIAFVVIVVVALAALMLLRRRK
jgi:hypothetical protein